MKFLPINKSDMKNRNWTQLDFVIVSGDAYVDHPSFGTAIISRLLERYGYKVGIIPQPDWNNLEEFKKMGKPKLAFLVTSGNIDSMVNHYTVFKKRRKKDMYSPEEKAGLRPDRAVIVYGNKIREAYKDIPIIIGGIESSLRRFAHYDYWSNSIRRSILLDSAADLLVYGMGEKSIISIAESLESGIPIEEITYIDGTVFRTKNLDRLYKYKILPSYKEITESKEKYAESFMMQYKNTDSINGEILVEDYGDVYVVANKPSEPLDVIELDDIYNLDYTRTYHPIYEKFGGISALKEVEFSITANRGCYGNCSFCALTFHQGRVIQKRSKESIIKEARILTKSRRFKGYITDVGGPTANFREKACEKQIKHGVCKNKECINPKCRNLNVTHKEYLEILREIRELKDVKKVFVRSGIRYDYLMYDKNDEFFRELCKYHVSGQLRTAPEHASDRVLKLMNKPSISLYKEFEEKFYKINKEINKEQYAVPYFISSHPGSTVKDAIELAEYIRDLGYIPEQVQDFYPTPGTLSTCMYYTGLDPRTMKKIHIPNSFHEKRLQRALLQYNKPYNYKYVKEALISEGRYDLIGNSKKALIKN
ncbi:MAG TPA: YgiQ family radical SAM protein [Clostridiales bacterium]|nr:YgiQ family radical SAM protein [Clostridiales bacterium]